MKLLSQSKNSLLQDLKDRSGLIRMSHVINLLGLSAAVFVFFDNMSWPQSGAVMAMELFLLAVGLVIFLPLVVSPYVGLFRLIRHRGGRIREVATLIFTAVVIFLSTFIYIDTFYIHLDAQGGLMFLFGPLYFWMLIGVFNAACWTAQKLHKTSKSTG